MKISFNWIIKDVLAGGSQAGLYNEMEDDLTILKNRGINSIITLTEKPLDIPEGNTDFKILHFPINDMGIPTPKKALEICNLIVEMIKNNEKVFIHCKAGLGRTGTILACVLVNMGRTDVEAIKEIRSVNNYYVQNITQERFVKHYYDFYTKENA